MQHWLDKLTDLAALRGDETVLKDALSLFAEQAGFRGYAYLYIRPGHTVVASNYHPDWLDPKEAAYLNWISVGKTMDEAADLEGVKYNSVKSKLEETRKRLQIHTMPHLVALAIRAGLI